MSMQRRPAPGRPSGSQPVATAVPEAELRRRLAAQPTSACDWQQLALVCAKGGRHAEAADAFAQAIEAGASAIALAAPRALSLSAAGRHVEAVSAVAAAQAKRPKDFALTNLLGVMLKRAGRLRESIPLFE